MADLPVSEIAGSPEPAAHKKGQFGVALEPQVIEICGYALLVGCIGGLVAQGLLSLSISSRISSFSAASPSRFRILPQIVWGCG